MMGAADPIGTLAGAPSPPRAGAVWTAFVETVTDLNAGRAGWPAELERARLWYEPHLDRIHGNSGTRHADLIHLGADRASLQQSHNGFCGRARQWTALMGQPTFGHPVRHKPAGVGSAGCCAYVTLIDKSRSVRGNSTRFVDNGENRVGKSAPLRAGYMTANRIAKSCRRVSTQDDQRRGCVK